MQRWLCVQIGGTQRAPHGQSWSIRGHLGAAREEMSTFGTWMVCVCVCVREQEREIPVRSPGVCEGGFQGRVRTLRRSIYPQWAKARRGQAGMFPETPLAPQPGLQPQSSTAPAKRLVACDRQAWE